MADHRSRAFAALLVTMLIWGSGAVFLRKMALELAPENSLALRYALLVLIFIPVLTFTKGWYIRSGDRLRFLLVGLAGMMGYNWFVNEGFARVAAGLGTVVTMVEPIIIALLAWALLREKLTGGIFIGLAISLGGAIILFWPDIVKSTSTPVDWWGILCLLGACICWAIYTIAAKPLLQTYGSFNVTALTMLISAPVLILLSSKPVPVLFAALTMPQWGELLFLVVLNALLGTLLWNYGTRHLAGALVGSFLYLVPVIAVGCGALILGEPVTFNLVTGGLIILAGVAISQIKWPVRLRKLDVDNASGVIR